jgi:hypothetical protein
MFSSRFECLAEIEALRAGFKPSGVCSILSIRLIPLHDDSRTGHLAPAGHGEYEVRQEMERRLTERLAKRRMA